MKLTKENKRRKRDIIRKLMAKAYKGNWSARCKLVFGWGYDDDRIPGYDDGEGPAGAPPFSN